MELHPGRFILVLIAVIIATTTNYAFAENQTSNDIGSLSTLDKVYYNDTNMIKIFGNVTEYRQSDKLTIVITDPNGEIGGSQIFPTSSGYYETFHIIDQNSPLGDYKIDASYRNKMIGKIYFELVMFNPITSNPVIQQEPPPIVEEKGEPVKEDEMKSSSEKYEMVLEGERGVLKINKGKFVIEQFGDDITIDVFLQLTSSDKPEWSPNWGSPNRIAITNTHFGHIYDERTIFKNWKYETTITLKELRPGKYWIFADYQLLEGQKPSNERDLSCYSSQILSTTEAFKLPNCEKLNSSQKYARVPSNYETMTFEVVRGENYKDILSFVDQSKDPAHYVERYVNEPKYKDWFNSQFPNYTIWEGIGISEQQHRKIVNDLNRVEQESKTQTSGSADSETYSPYTTSPEDLRNQMGFEAPETYEQGLSQMYATIQYARDTGQIDQMGNWAREANERARIDNLERWENLSFFEKHYSSIILGSFFAAIVAIITVVSILVKRRKKHSSPPLSNFENVEQASTQQLLSFCNICNNPINPNEKFCGKCGSLTVPKPTIKLEPACQNCKNPLKPNEKFCGKCGYGVN